MPGSANIHSRMRVLCYDEWRAAISGGGGGVGADDENQINGQLDAVCRLPVRDGYFNFFFANQSKVSNIFISINKRQFISATIDSFIFFAPEINGKIASVL